MTNHSVLSVCVLLSLVVMIATAGCMYTWRDLDRTISDDKIVSLDIGQTLQGSFFIGCGNVNGITYYYYYKIESDGAYTLQKAPTEYSRIYMDANPDNSHVIIINMDQYPTQCRNDQTDEYCKQNSWVFKKNYVFHVPKGTIVEEYNVGRGAP